MSLYPDAVLLEGADWSQNDQRRQTVRAVTVHTTQGTNSVGVGQSRHHNTPGTFNFLISADGTTYQFYPADVRCSHADGANHAGPGIELEGFTGEPRPLEQLAALGRLAVWLANTYNAPLFYATGDPRVYIDQALFRGFTAHRHVKPTLPSNAHTDEITPDEWMAALALPPPEDEGDADMFLGTIDGQTFYLFVWGNGVTQVSAAFASFYKGPRGLVKDQDEYNHLAALCRK